MSGTHPPRIGRLVRYAPTAPSRGGPMTTGRSPESVPARAPSVAAPSSTGGALAGALVALREAAAATRFALDIPGAEGARESGAELVRQLDDYLLPRLRRLDAPLLAVVGGSTGAGKSTLVNSLVRAQVSPAGVLRPTTQVAGAGLPPRRLRWFSDSRVLPELTRTITPPVDLRLAPLRRCPTGQRRRPQHGDRTLQLVTSAALARAGVAGRPRHRLGRDRQPAAGRRNCSPPPTCGSSSRPRPATPTPCRGSCCTPPRSAAPRSRCCSTGCRRAPGGDRGAPQEMLPSTGWPVRRCSSCRRRP